MSVRTTIRSTRGLIIAVVVLIAAAAAAVVFWQRGGEAAARETCPAGAATSAEISVEPDDGAVEVSAEIDGAEPGQIWRVRLEQGEATLLDGERTVDDDGEIELDALAEEAAGDRFAFEASSQTGLACGVSVER